MSKPKIIIVVNPPSELVPELEVFANIEGDVEAEVLWVNRDDMPQWEANRKVNAELGMKHIGTFRREE
ncbi:MAG: hypothetical protein PHH26_00770 [Candidatus Thermoplasmatota archaeon]|nr:hypothetical protein [Candidatus Thermoplasmatota archaeon]